MAWVATRAGERVATARGSVHPTKLVAPHSFDPDCTTTTERNASVGYSDEKYLEMIPEILTERDLCLCRD